MVEVMNTPRITRRDLLLRAGGGVALALGAGTRSGAQGVGHQASARTIHWAAGWLLWRDFAPRTIALAEALRDLRDVGCDGIEFTPRPGELAAAGLTLDVAKGLLQEHGLRVSAHYLSAPFHDPSKKAEVFALAQEKFDSLRAFGATNIVIGPPTVPAGVDRAACIGLIGPILTELGRRARDQGLAIGVHPHLNTVIETADELDLIMSMCDPAFVGLALDTGHFHLAGGDVVGAVKKYAARLNYFHFKDAVRPFIRPDFFPNLRELGKGTIDFRATMRVIAEVGYTGWINVEQDATTTSPRESIRESMRYVRDALA